jgi:hypothetical protein
MMAMIVTHGIMILTTLIKGQTTLAAAILKMSLVRVLGITTMMTAIVTIGISKMNMIIFVPLVIIGLWMMVAVTSRTTRGTTEISTPCRTLITWRILCGKKQVRCATGSLLGRRLGLLA